ncbi:MAG: hypothetical protein ABI475_09935 [Methylophilaceae bacterium]
MLLKVISAYTWRVNSDEPQHLHIVWAWANGLLQYRDVFDNHTPLFHMLFAPIYSLFGERADILVLMRLTVIPLFFMGLWAVYLIGKALYSRHIGLWAMIFTALYPRFFLTAGEFRADDLWMVPWLLALAILVQKQLRASHLFVAGLLLGTALSISMKTGLLLCALGLATLIVTFLQRNSQPLCIRKYAINTISLLVGFTLVPLALILFFSLQGAWASMYYGVIQHNIVPGLGNWKHLQNCVWPIAVIVSLIIGGTYLIQCRSTDHSLRKRRLMIFLTYGFAMLGLYGAWPLITNQDFMPLTPLIIIVATGLLLQTRGGESKKASQYARTTAILAVIALLEFSTLVTKAEPWNPHTLAENSLLAEVLQLTHPGETIMDFKGETVFRQRPFFYALEDVTLKRIELGMIKDSIPEDMTNARTTVATLNNSRFSARDQEFLGQNFLPIGHLRVLGQYLAAPNTKANSNFNIRVPSSYAVIAAQGTANGWLDGIPYHGPRKLDAGPHTFRSANPDTHRLAIIWAPAIERGFSPFAPGRSS